MEEGCGDKAALRVSGSTSLSAVSSATPPKVGSILSREGVVRITKFCKNETCSLYMFALSTRRSCQALSLSHHPASPGAQGGQDTTAASACRLTKQPQPASGLSESSAPALRANTLLGGKQQAEVFVVGNWDRLLCSLADTV